MLQKLPYKQRHGNWQKRLLIVVLPIFIFVSTVSFILAIHANDVHAATSDTLNFQGRLLDDTGNLVVDGDYNMEFNLYTVDSGGSSQWTETRLVSASQGVTVQNGYFSVYLGDVTTFPTTIDWDQEQWLGMTVRGTGSCAWGSCTPTDSEMTPRFKLTAVPYAFRAGAVVDSSGNAYTGDDLVHKAPSSIQTVTAAVAALRLNQTGSGALIQMQGDGSDIFTVSKAGEGVFGAGVRVGNSSSTTAGTIRWNGSDLEVYDGSQWTSLTSGGGGGSAVGVSVIKSTDESLNSNATLQNDDELLFAIGANEEWNFRFTVHGNTDTQPDFRFAVTAPSGATCVVGIVDSEGASSEGNLGCGTSSNFVAGTGNDEVYEVVGSVTNGNNAGNVTLQWAQFSSNTATTTVRAGSSLFATATGAAGTSFEQNGNSFGATAVLGTNDAFGLDFETNGVTRASITSGGSVSFVNDVTVGNGLTVTTGGLTVSAGGVVLTGGVDNNSGGITEAGAISGLTSLTGSGALTLSSGGSGDLTLDSASDVLVISDATLRRTAAGTTTIDLLDSSANTTLSLTNSDGTRVAGLSVEGNISANAISGDGSGLTGLDGSNIASGTVSDARLSSNVALLNGTQTFTGVPTFNSGLIVSDSTSTTAGAIRWSGSDFEGYDGVSWQSLTSGGGGGGGGSSPALTTVIKGTDEIVNNSATLQNDNDLLFAVGANEDWAFRFVLQGNSSAVANFKFAVTAPSGATCDVSIIDSEGAVTVGNLGCGVASGLIAGNGADDLYEVVGTVRNGSTAGNVTLQWAQNTATATNSTILAGSYLSAQIDGGGLQFLQGGNDFGATAVLGTTASNNLNLIVNNSTLLSLTTGNQAIFSGAILANGDTTLGDEASDGLTIVSDSVSLTNGLNFDSNTFVIDAANNRVAIGDATPDNQFGINNAATADASARGLIYTNGVTNKGLVIQATASQTANLFEVQNSSGTTLAGFNASGALVLGQSTIASTASASRAITFPDEAGTVCLSGSDNCGFIELATGSTYTDASNNNVLVINKTSATGSLLQFQRSAAPVFTIANTGALQIQASSSTALDIRNTSGTSYFSVDTSTGTVRVGPATADAVGVLFVLDTKNTSGDPTGTNGAMYYNSNLGKFRCYEAGSWKDCTGTRQLRSFVDTVNDTVSTSNTVNYWDTGSENNNSTPNITPSASTKAVFGSVSVQISSSTTQDRSVVTRVERNIGSAPTCGSGTTVGFYASTFTTNSGEIVTATVTFLDNPNTTSQVFYTLCSDSNTSSSANVQVDKIRITLEEANNSN